MSTMLLSDFLNSTNAAFWFSYNLTYWNKVNYTLKLNGFDVILCKIPLALKRKLDALRNDILTWIARNIFSFI